MSLHGAGGDAQGGLRLLRELAERRNFLLLAPSSAGSSWDAIHGTFGPDVTTLDQALGECFRKYAVDAKRIAIGGFSDGASYALSVGLANGRLFRSVLAFSPGFVRPAREEGRPRVFISHGTRDAVLPIDPCSRRIVAGLKGVGYDVAYREFDGPHTVPADMREEAVRWWLGR